MVYLTVREVATALRVHPNTVRKYIGRGLLKATKLLGSIRISERDLEAMMKEEEL